jgi:hypothetical protein
MSTVNPFANDPIKGEIFEEGWFAGFSDPVSSHLLPLAPELLEVYEQGVEAGREDRTAPPIEDSSEEWAGLEELGEHVIIHALGHITDHLFRLTVGGVIGLVTLVVGIPSDVKLRPLDPEFDGPPDAAGDEVYLAMCPREDHPLVAIGVTPEGYWTGQPRASIGDAVRDVLDHKHPEGFVARCSESEGTCGAVWPTR